MRRSSLSRTTLETSVEVSMCLDGTGSLDLQMQPEFMRHMVTTMAVHAGMDVCLRASGDLTHHTIEDVALCLGRSIRECVGQGATIRRYGHTVVPMDCSLAMVAVDLCDRPYTVVDLATPDAKVEDTQTEDIVHFFSSLASALHATVHVKVFYGANAHHKIEAAFKALGIALRQAVQVRGENDPPVSAKGVL